MLYFGRVGSSWGHCAFFGCSWGKKVITPKKKKVLVEVSSLLLWSAYYVW